MVLFPNCKINLGLNIIEKRKDGYHNLETVFYPVAWNDALELVTSPEAPYPGIQFNSSGLPIAGDPDSNLCTKAYQLLAKDFPRLPAVRVHLHKAIPMGAGLGGGSSNGAFMLKMLNEKLLLGLDATQLMGYALQLGSDCPFFIRNTPCIATGRGEDMQPLALDLNAYRMVLINPAIHVSTAWAFAQLKPQPAAIPVSEAIRKPIEQWKDILLNDFEAPVIKQFPEIGQIKEQLYQSGALYASMTGSGSTLFGIFPANRHLESSIEQHHSIKEISPL
ncbi:4-diphosphocytidyl-2-C-methyl-D-erythritol kinase [Hydrobacter penzbergensis]|uniref:4-diphosphocytidyl-2-C-methyl-D-erythritol kinase n=1 Tax=Hydrobacter penzbergensis TaxID=1235997 RepID=A0A8X8L9R4_9BACT|nr:4-(cytidine 5'-diphospho)-2-C-methyl-D-erythritol kinase [Hydrobacter penzbergensis]SDW09965.1 4-diphosphocytidyl-2-C-methyl-D-erythritol kinase [Hydrobacter penzbergensis]